jgi:hypothetical protein
MWAGKEKGICLFTDSDLLARFIAGLKTEAGDSNEYSQMGALSFSDRSVMLDTLKQLQPVLHAKNTTRIVMDPTVGGRVRSVPLTEFIAAFERL